METFSDEEYPREHFNGKSTLKGTRNSLTRREVINEEQLEHHRGKKKHDMQQYG